MVSSLKRTHLDAVIELVADIDVVVERLSKRARNRVEADDDESVVRHRLGVYAEQTAPLIEVYGQRGVLVSVDGIGAIDEVTSPDYDRTSQHTAYTSSP
jgi:adenylate kinase